MTERGSTNRQLMKQNTQFNLKSELYEIQEEESESTLKDGVHIPEEK